jgi:hypothetical protein
MTWPHFWSPWDTTMHQMATKFHIVWWQPNFCNWNEKGACHEFLQKHLRWLSKKMPQANLLRQPKKFDCYKEVDWIFSITCNARCIHWTSKPKFHYFYWTNSHRPCFCAHN